MFRQGQQESVFPVAYGNEEETGLLDNTRSYYDEPYQLAEGLEKYMPVELLGHKEFLTNGFKLYAGGCIKSELITNIERATPECSTPQELVAYIRASEILIKKLVENYVSIESAYDDTTIDARIQRRVVDGEGNRKGCHDNFGIQIDDDENEEIFFQDAKLSITNHLATRSFVTGAGHIKNKQLRFAQKINGLERVSGYGYFGSMYRLTKEPNDIIKRFEVRCNDINISDWATLVRIGSTALVLALNRTPLGREMNQYFFQPPIDLAKQFNKLHVHPDGTLDRRKIEYEAVDYQQKIAELAMDKLQLHVDELPLEHYEVAKELYEYCEDFRKVAKGESTIELLADRADWAAKFMLQLKGIKKDQEFGISRKINDVKSRALDLRYDYIGISATGGDLQPTKKGLAYKLRDKGFFRKTIPENKALLAYRKAPQTTRAAVRAELLQKYPVQYCDWNVVEIDRGVTVHFRDVRKNEPDNFDHLNSQ